MIKKVHGSWFIVHSLLLFLALYAVLCTPYPAFAQAISSSELISNAKQYDGRLVVYEGEVIGDIMARGEYAWINIHDGKNAIGIWISKDLTKDIFFTGSYSCKGDWVEISGIFQRACLQHGGDLDIHAQAIKNIKPGRRIQEKLNLSKANQTLALLGLLGFLWILKLLKRK